MSDPSRIALTAISAGELLAFAFDLPLARISGNPEWLYQVSYDVVATTSAPANKAEQKLMLQALLADRFALVYHREQQASQVYAQREKNPSSWKPRKKGIARSTVFSRG